MNTLIISALAFLTASATASPVSSKHGLIVSQTAAKGHNVFRTVQEAVNAVPDHATSEQLIFVEAGIYFEQVIIPKTKPFITIVGAGGNSSVVQFDRSSNSDGSSVTPTTFQVNANDFTSFGMTYMNTNTEPFLGADGVRLAGPSPALYTAGERTGIYNSWILGWQDTLLTQAGQAFYENTYIEGAVDYIWGQHGAAFFRNCTLNTLRSGGYIVAEGTAAQPDAGNLDLDQQLNSTFGGYVMESCTLTAPEGVTNWFLGRPWGTGATAFYVDSFIPDSVNPTYWHTMTAGATPLYSTINCTGPGANSDSINTDLSVVVSQQQAEEFLTLDAWLPDSSSWIQEPNRFN
ncbi:pectin lyase fold/virulence factor [Blyttiomyces helicus]|uniref:pectinesterase n=1 Tax=Blyttiomyces helicus TaxID=388810 RepID=A0A4P9WFV2_9FUNG|nr:pectin lyase fold/virulence factor [Blyttiomyces helicus]|eukprot:RKO90663.1 pectin lyase fold/virulence factor [Blyttiomyces helicus]